MKKERSVLMCFMERFISHTLLSALTAQNTLKLAKLVRKLTSATKPSFYMT